MDEGIAIAWGAMTKTIAFPQEASFPDKLTSLGGRAQVSTWWPGSVPKQQRMHHSRGSVAPVDQAVFVIALQKF